MGKQIWLMILLVVIVLSGCVQFACEEETPDEEGPIQTIAHPPVFYSGVVSIEELVLESDTIARVELLRTSTSTTSHAYTNYEGVADALWCNNLEFTFRAHEYLKGSGPAELVAVAPYCGSQTWAQGTGMTDTVALHDTSWDDRGAIVFLNQVRGRYSFRGFASGENHYQVSSRHAKEWLPEAVPSQTRGTRGTSGTDTLYLLDAPASSSSGVAGSSSASAGTPPTISLSALKNLVAGITSELSAATTTQHVQCIERYYYHDRLIRWKHKTGQYPVRYEHTLSSGRPAGVGLYEDTEGYGNSQEDYGRYWFEGANPDLVRFSPTAFTPWQGGVRFNRRVVTARPLPHGAYQFYFNSMTPWDLLCNKYPDLARTYVDHRLTVSQPERTLHEAFFDSVNIGSAVGADSTNGVLKPSAFSLDGTTTTISSLKWEAGAATMTLSPAASLAGYAIDFIALDGSVTSTLAFDDATQSGGTLTWSVATQPWNAGDLLMLRITARPSIAISGLDASIEAGQTDAFTVSASNMATSTSYTIRVTTDDPDIGFDSTCADRQEDTTVPAASTSHDAAFTLRACSTTGGTVTATLLEGTTAVATTTQEVTVTARTTPEPTPTPTAPSPPVFASTTLQLHRRRERVRIRRRRTGLRGRPRWRSRHVLNSLWQRRRKVQYHPQRRTDRRPGGPRPRHHIVVRAHRAGHRPHRRHGHRRSQHLRYRGAVAARSPPRISSVATGGPPKSLRHGGGDGLGYNARNGTGGREVTSQLRDLPSVQRVLSDERVRRLVKAYSHDAVVELVRSELDAARLAIRNGGAPRLSRRRSRPRWRTARRRGGERGRTGSSTARGWCCTPISGARR